MAAALVGVSALSVLVAGAFVAGHGVGVAAGVAGAVFIVPLTVGLASARGLPLWGLRGARTAAGLHVVALMAAFVFFAEPTSVALRTHGAWPATLVANADGHDDHVADELTRFTVAAADLLHAPPAPPPAPPETSTKAAKTPTSPKEVFAARADSVVVVHVRQAAPPAMKALVGVDEAEGHGSGFVVDGGFVVTNHHVAGEATSIRVRQKDGTSFDEVAVVYVDPQNDLAVLKVDGLTAAPVPIASAEPAVGDGVVVIGSPLGLDYTLTTGLVSAVRDQSTTRMLQIDAVVAPGSSGGPVFSDQGALIGVATAMQGQGLNMAVGAQHVREALTKATAPDVAAPKVLARWAAGFEMQSIEAEGGALLPTTRSNLLGVLPHLVQSVEGCLVGRPAGEAVVVVDGGVELKEGSDKLKTCVREKAMMFGIVTKMATSDAASGVKKVLVRYGAADGRVTVVELVTAH